MDNQKLKNILRKEIDFHSKGILEHKKLMESRQGNAQRKKKDKHFNKRFQTIKIAEKLGFEFCENCGGLK